MKKVGIITLNGYFNYGNRLQNFALQEVIKDLGFHVETIIVAHDKEIVDNKTNRNIYNIFIRNNGDIKVLMSKLRKKIWTYTKRNEIKESMYMKNEIFKEFTLNNINETKFTITNNRIPNNLSNTYDFFVTGSDQVWNPSYNCESSIYFLTFTEKYKRIAYAASFGISEIKPKYVESYGKWISQINHLSVREEEAAKIIKELTGRDAFVLLDPTMLKSREEWLTISNEAPNKPKNKYLLTYFLGGIPTSYKNQIRNIAKRYKLDVINMGDIRDKDTYRTGPREFIDYINSCNLFCTDSFHGMVFSIIFEKPFISFERVGSDSMFSRINTLLNKFNLNSRKVENILWDKNIFDVDYSHVPKILESEKIKSIEFLKNALKTKEEKIR